MTVASNKQTQQPSITGQTIKYIAATRVYFAAANTAEPAAGYLTASVGGSGVLTGWTDLGAIKDSKVTIEYTKEIKEVRSGIDGILRATYIGTKTANASFALDNYDYTVMGQVLGQSTTDITVSSTVIGKKLWIGEEEVVSKALLFVASSKIDSKEHRFYSKSADLSFVFEEDDEAVVIRVTASLSAFIDTVGSRTLDCFLAHSFYEANIWSFPTNN